MKYLYKILRLFVCPHKWILKEVVEVYEYSTSKLPYCRKRTLQCKYCGKLKFRKY